MVSQSRIRVRQLTATHHAVPVGKGETDSAESQGRILVHFGKRVIFYDWYSTDNLLIFAWLGGVLGLCSREAKKLLMLLSR